MITACRRAPPEEGGQADRYFAVEAEVSDVVPTVVRVTATVDLPDVTAVRIDYGQSREHGHEVEATDVGDGVFEARIWGLKPGRTWHYCVTATNADGDHTSKDHEFETGSPPSSLPDLSIDDPEAFARIGGYWVTALVSVPSTPVILDSDGELVWWYTDTEDDISIVSRSVVSQDGESILYLNFPTQSENQYATFDLVRVSIDGSEVERTAVTAPHHDFVELPDGTVAIIAYDTIQVEGEDVDGDKIVEVRPDGSIETAWSIWDEVEYDSGLAEELEGTGWSHANAIDYDPVVDAYDISLSNLQSVYRVDRATGRAYQRVGGFGSDYVLEGTGEADLFERIHQFDFTSEGIIAFDNGMAENLASRVVQYSLDRTTGLATETWSYEADPALFIPSLGDAFVLEGGTRIVVWSTAGQMQELDATGQVIWQLNTDVGAGLGYTTWLDSL